MDPRDAFAQAFSEIQDMIRALSRYADRRPVALLVVGSVLVYVALRRKNEVAMGLLGVAGIAIFVYLFRLLFVG